MMRTSGIVLRLDRLGLIVLPIEIVQRAGNSSAARSTEWRFLQLVIGTF